eukprot:CAMPEP_0172469186 /NCGR_PEP_ID=MMETSP1065-20121228/63120_1 /TAXON_ID=265537 /ORGANISM="Amphiprora paludosa, Strain CCMP125" /LENGTH=233 /DNA_ID=CAMNT_0013226783 /DNA_START=64 /DNA_END=765 /DNA_ORIENTATION=+
MERALREYFLVQRCWFDGPIISPPQDYQALFTQRGEAEEIASHSAQLHAANHQAVVRTILLPSGYAFSAAGNLFWVRSVWVNADVEQTYGEHFDLSFGAHAICNGNVIGGTGNPNSRRGSEATTGVVFVGPSSHAMALHVLQHGGVPANSKITWIPFAPLSNPLDGWTGDIIKEQPCPDTLKRRAADASASSVVVAVSDDSLDRRPGKRQCGVLEHAFTSNAVESTDTAMQTS